MTSFPFRPSSSDSSSGQSRLTSTRQRAGNQPQSANEQAVASTYSNAQRRLTPIGTNVASASNPWSSRRANNQSSSSASSNSGPSQTTSSTFSSALSSDPSSGPRERGHNSQRSIGALNSPIKPTSASRLSFSQLLSSNPSSASPTSALNPFQGSALSNPSNPARIGSGSSASSVTQRGGNTSNNTQSLTGGVSGNSAISPASSNGTGQDTTRVVIAQVSILLGFLKDDSDKAKWDTQATQIKKLVGSNMDVFVHYFRRLVSSNSSRLALGSQAGPDTSGSLALLIEEVKKVSTDPDQAARIAEALDLTDGEPYKDFDLASFADALHLDALEKTILALGFTASMHETQRSAAKRVVLSQYEDMINILSSWRSHADIPTIILEHLVDNLINSPSPRLDEEAQANLVMSLRLRYQDKGSSVPDSLAPKLATVKTGDSQQALSMLLKRRGPSSTSSVSEAKSLLRLDGSVQYTDSQIADAIWYMTSEPDSSRFNFENFISALKGSGESAIRWGPILQTFDQPNRLVTTIQFKSLFHFFTLVARQDESVPVQNLWGGAWKNKETQMSFLICFMALEGENVGQIPGIDCSFTVNDFSDREQAIQDLIQEAIKNPLISTSAIVALIHLAFEKSSDAIEGRAGELLLEVAKTFDGLFLSGAFAVEKPWQADIKKNLTSLFQQFFSRQLASYQAVLPLLWKRDSNWVASCLIEIHTATPMALPLIFDHAVNFGWLDDLLTIQGLLGLDLAAFAHSPLAPTQEKLDLENWLQNFVTARPAENLMTLIHFVGHKVNDELRDDDEERRQTPLAVRTVNAIMNAISEHLPAQATAQMDQLERGVIEAYPRLSNYGEGYDHIIDENGKQSNKLPSEIEPHMQKYYEELYQNKTNAEPIVRDMEKFKHSSDPQEQDLFACLVHNLFVEYPHLHVYTPVALGWAAVLYGTLVGRYLISGISMKVALSFILEAAAEIDPEVWRYRFGAQALEKLVNRLPELPLHCEVIAQIPNLRDSKHPAYVKAEEVLQQHRDNPALRGRPSYRMTNGHSNGAYKGDGSVDGMIEDMAAGSLFPNFESIHAESPPTASQFSDPDEDVQDRVLFVLNNVSEQNLEVKLQDLTGVLENKHHQWFAEYLVEHRAKMQPNYHAVYLDLLTQIGQKTLWAEVLRETYISIVKMLNAESTTTSSHERTFLKNLGSWLGMLTLARNKPIRHRNIAFTDLLLEALDTQRLISVLPFTCKVLEKAADSLIFQPPNPWLMNIMRLLVEFYHFAELKLNLKFEIEVLCKKLDLDYKDIEPALRFRDRVIPGDEPTNILPDNGGAFDDDLTAGLGGITGRFSLEALLSTLPDIGPLLRYPDLEGFVLPPQMIRATIQTAVEEAIRNIILPTVDRTVSVTATTTTNVVISDYSMEPSEVLLQEGAFKMARALVGPLAMVTCKDPLRMNMTHNLRNAFQMDGDGSGIVPESFIMICVNDNIDLACEVVQRAAEDHSMAEIEERLGPAVRSRIEHRQSQRSEPFADPIPSPFAFRLPDPYKFSQNGLNQAQLRVYDEFNHEGERNALGYLDHHSESYTGPPSQYAGNHIGQEGSDHPLRPLSSDRGLTGSRGVSTSRTIDSHPHMNGYLSSPASSDLLDRLLLEMRSNASLSDVAHYRDLKPEDPISATFEKFFALLYRMESRSTFAAAVAPNLCLVVIDEPHKPLELELNLHLISKLCQLDTTTHSQVVMFFDGHLQQENLGVAMILGLLDNGLTTFQHVDLSIQQSLLNRNERAIDLFTEIVKEVLLSSRARALRTDFAGSISALTQWLMSNSTLSGATRLFKLLEDAESRDSSEEDRLDKSSNVQEQIEYTFLEWIHLCCNPMVGESDYAVFIAQIHHRHILESPSDTVKFFRVCLEMGLNDYEDQLVMEDASRQAGNEERLGGIYTFLDSLARLIVLFARYHGLEQSLEVSSHTEHIDRILSLLVLLLFRREGRSTREYQKPFYRLFSSILCFIAVLKGPAMRFDMIQSLRQKLVVIRPQVLPGFACAWLSLISHRNFISYMLSDEDINNTADIPTTWTDYLELLILALNWFGELQQPQVPELFGINIYKGLMRIFLILHHDFSSFLAVHHIQLCVAIPMNCVQLRHLVLNAAQYQLGDIPHPMIKGLDIDRLPQAHEDPCISFDFDAAIASAGLEKDVTEALNGNPSSKHINAISQAVRFQKRKRQPQQGSGGIDTLLLQAIVLSIGTAGVSTQKSSDSAQFSEDSPASHLLQKLVTDLDPDVRYHLINAIANQLRVPNSHTIYFSHALHHLFEQEKGDEQTEIRQCIMRVLLERAWVPQPHPWGLLMTVVELVRNPKFGFWELPFVKGSPEVQHLVQTVMYRDMADF